MPPARFDRWFDPDYPAATLRKHWMEMAHPDSGLVPLLRDLLNGASSAEVRIDESDVMEWAKCFQDVACRKDVLSDLSLLLSHAVIDPVREALGWWGSGSQDRSPPNLGAAQLVGERQRSVRLPVIGVLNESTSIPLMMELTRWDCDTPPAVQQEFCNRFRVAVDAEFRASAERAVALASHFHCDRQGAARPTGVFSWALLQTDEGTGSRPDVLRLHGSSASAAMALGLYHLMADTWPDPGVAILASVGQPPAEFAPVLHVADKVHALLRACASGIRCYGDLDTIIVTDAIPHGGAQANLDEAERERARIIREEPDLRTTAERFRIVAT